MGLRERKKIVKGWKSWGDEGEVRGDLWEGRVFFQHRMGCAVQGWLFGKRGAFRPAGFFFTLPIPSSRPTSFWPKQLSSFPFTSLPIFMYSAFSFSLLPPSLAVSLFLKLLLFSISEAWPNLRINFSGTIFRILIPTISISRVKYSTKQKWIKCRTNDSLTLTPQNYLLGSESWTM